MKGLRNIPKGSNNWYGYIYDKTKNPARKSIPLKARNRHDAQIEWGRLISEYARGAFDPWAEDEPDEDATLRTVIDHYMREHRRQAYETLKTKRSIFESFEDTLSDGRLSRITEKDVERYVERGNLRESTRKKNLSRLQLLFDWAIERDYTEENPARRYAKRRRRGISMYDRREQERLRKDIFLPSEMEDFCAGIVKAETEASPSAHASFSYLSDLFSFYATTGLRRKEAIYLNVRDVSLTRVGGKTVCGQVFVRCWEHGGESFRTKTGKDRVVPLPPRAALILDKYLDGREEAGYRTAWEPVFTGPKDGRRLIPQRISRYFRELRDAQEVRKTIVLHSMRHTYLSWLVMLHIDPYLIREIAGHADLSVQSRYIHIVSQYAQGRARSLQREVLQYLCPGVDEEKISEVLPKSEEWVRTNQFKRSGAPVEDVLFGGLLYR